MGFFLLKKCHYEYFLAKLKYFCQKHLICKILALL